MARTPAVLHSIMACEGLAPESGTLFETFETAEVAFVVYFSTLRSVAPVVTGNKISLAFLRLRRMFLVDSPGKRTQDWQDTNPLIVWRKAQGLSRPRAAEAFGMTDRRLMELEVGFAPLDVEWKAITPRTGITPAQWTAWEREKPHIAV
jgi:hypothetical protein